MDDTTTIVIVEDEAPAEDETINFDAEVGIMFTISRTYRVDMAVRQIIEDFAKASTDNGHDIREPDDAEDPADYVCVLLDENPLLAGLVLDEWAKTADIEDEETTVDEVV